MLTSNCKGTCFFVGRGRIVFHFLRSLDITSMTRRSLVHLYRKGPLSYIIASRWLPQNKMELPQMEMSQLVALEKTLRTPLTTPSKTDITQLQVGVQQLFTASFQEGLAAPGHHPGTSMPT